MSLQTTQEAIYPRPLSGAPVNNPPPALLPTRAPIVGRWVTLEPQDAERDAAELFEAGHSTPEGLAIWDYLAYGPWPSLEAYKQTLKAQAASFDPIFYTIRCHATGKCCGQITLMDLNAINGVAEIGNIWFGPELQRTRAATEALFLAMDYPMSRLGYRRMQWRCNAQNQRSRAAARRLGFRFEGIFYNHLIFKGKNRDTAWYSILDNEWPVVREMIGYWLADENFDEQGQAIESLNALMQHRDADAWERNQTGGEQ